VASSRSIGWCRKIAAASQVSAHVSRAGYDLHAFLSVLQQGSPSVVRHDPRSGDFDLAKIGDRYLATSGDFSWPTDSKK
jgi:hypothetical protein